MTTSAPTFCYQRQDGTVYHHPETCRCFEPPLGWTSNAGNPRIWI